VSPTTRTDTGGRVANDDVPSYVAAVRARLDDLAPDEVEELTGGLEADLAEALAGFDETPRQRFGDPAAYADELRASADLPPRQYVPSAGIGGALRGMREAFGENFDAMRRLPWFPPVRDFLLVVRPAWWVLRAWVLLSLLRVMTGAEESGIVGGFSSIVVLLLAIVGSVTLGRRTARLSLTGRALLAIGNVVAVLALVPVGAQFAVPDSRLTDASPGSGLWMDGQPLTDVIPYDSQGRPLQGVQLYDAQGRPLSIGEDFRWYDDGLGQQRWNVFPLSSGDPADPGAESTVVPPAPTPVDTVPSPTATPSPSATPSARAGTTAPVPSGAAPVTPSATMAP
jgi:hypothetical protein